MLAAAAGATQAVDTGTAPQQAGAGLEGLAGRQDSVGLSSKPSTEAGVWVAEGSRARTLWSDRRNGTVSSDLGGQTLGPISAVRVVAKGKAHDVVTNARTVQELLSAMRIEPDGDDRVVPPPSTALSRTRTVTYAAADVRPATGIERGILRPYRVPPLHGRVAC